MPTPDAVQQLIAEYWRSNIRTMAVLLAVWAGVGIGAGILFADYLNAFTIPGTGFPLGFWFAHQGSIITFVIVILIYCVLMNRLDRRHHESIESLRQQDPR